MKALASFFPISARCAGHGVRCTLLALRFSVMQGLPVPGSSYYHDRKSAIDSVRWLDLHCHLNAIHHRGATQ